MQTARLSANPATRQVVREDDIHLDSEIVKDLVKQLRAQDTYDSYDGWSTARIIDPIVLTKERKRQIPVVGDPDGLTVARLKAYYNTVATLVENSSGLMAVPVVNLSHEGFGRAMVIVGKLVVVDKILRDVHRWGFDSLEELCAQTAKTCADALALIQQHNSAASA